MTEIIIESIGWFGSILILGAYFLNMQHKILATSPFYIWANLVGGFCFVINTYYNSAFPSMTLNIIWVLIAVYSLVKANKEAK